jgi:hypothetical protein
VPALLSALAVGWLAWPAAEAARGEDFAVVAADYTSGPLNPSFVRTVA